MYCFLCLVLNRWWTMNNLMIQNGWLASAHGGSFKFEVTAIRIIYNFRTVTNLILICPLCARTRYHWNYWTNFVESQDYQNQHVRCCHYAHLTAMREEIELLKHLPLLLKFVMQKIFWGLPLIQGTVIAESHQYHFMDPYLPINVKLGHVWTLPSSTRCQIIPDLAVPTRNPRHFWHSFCGVFMIEMNLSDS